MQTLSINEKINAKSQNLREYRAQIKLGGAPRLIEWYSFKLDSKIRAAEQNYEVNFSSPFFQYQKDSDRKIRHRFNYNGELTHPWLSAHPEVHSLIFLM